MDKTNLTQPRRLPVEDDSDMLGLGLDEFEDAIDEPCLYDEIMDLVNVRRDRLAQ